MKKHQIIYTLISPDGTRNIIDPIVMYTTTESILAQQNFNEECVTFISER